METREDSQQMDYRNDTKLRCPVCEGRGWRFMAPHGVNPFNVRLPHLASMLERRNCWSCYGSGKRS